ncbi:MAG: DUF1801 domain-containing protein [Sphaerochaeta sp.]|jgi:uncharacterized protein YdhG (YjbR/CyaY superfamily)|nr:DUF1801 domain-containing protein [Sphaerochaeta sp.]HAP57890.1 hypothetical protein [Sphaerochaeta sp.]
MGAYAAEVDAYIKQFDDDRQQRLQAIRALVHPQASDASECISWRMPTFRLAGGGNIIQIAAFKNHIGLYPEPEAIEAFKAELSGFPTSKGAIQLPLDRPLPLDLIERIILYRLGKARTKA